MNWLFSANLQNLEYALDVTSDKDREEHSKSAKENDETLMKYYSALIHDWHSMIQQGVIRDEDFLVRIETLQQNLY